MAKEGALRRKEDLMTTLGDLGRQHDDVPHVARALGRTAAVLAIGSALVHLLLVDLAQLGSLAMVAMALACLPCAWHLWRSASSQVWALTATADVTMLVLHAQLQAAPLHSTAHLHNAAVSGQSRLMGLGLGLIAAQLALAALTALTALPRRAGPRSR